MTYKKFNPTYTTVPSISTIQDTSLAVTKVGVGAGDTEGEGAEGQGTGLQGDIMDSAYGHLVQVIEKHSKLFSLQKSS